jgi:signal transduction histidine kinase
LRVYQVRGGGYQPLKGLRAGERNGFESASTDQGVEGVAFRWRIRHKLMLGLALVLGINAMLLGGTIYGLAKFRATVRSMDSKNAELVQAHLFRVALTNLKSMAEKSDDRGMRSELLQRIPEVQQALRDYEDRLEDTLVHGRDPDQGFQERELVQVLREGLEKLTTVVSTHRALAEPNRGTSIQGENRAILSVIRSLEQPSSDLADEIRKDLANRSRDAKATFRSSLWLIVVMSVAAMVFMSWLVRFFYGWAFYPIRDLEQGAGRVAQGDFEHRIEVHSGDEMEELAEAFNDMTGRLREMYRDLARQVNERSRQLVRSERLASVGFLAAGVAHEINNPLASIAFCSEALEGRVGPLLARFPDDAKLISKYLKMIQEEAFRCKAITQRLLEFSRGGERRREQTDLVELIQAVLDMVQHLQNVKGKHIVFDPPSRLVAWVNAQEVKSVVLNLVVNALDSMDDGGTLTILLRQRGPMAEMVFRDTGCGMSPDVLENIFEPFFTRSRTGKGTGLGLSISHRVINQHGGEIEASSPGPNKGSTFVVRLPLQPAELSKEESFGHVAA